MNEFEKKIREAMFASSGSSYSQTSLPAPQDGETSTLSFGTHRPTSRLRLNHSSTNTYNPSNQHRLENSANRDYNNNTQSSHQVPSVNSRPLINNPSPPEHSPPGRALSAPVDHSALSKPGVMMGNWDNPLIAAAIPVLLQVERVQNQGQVNPVTVRAQMVREIQQFQRRVLKDNARHEDMDNLAYLLCAYVDECCMSPLGGGALNLSLLVEFYRDSWGGEKCFIHLQNYLSTPQRDRNILAFYDLILSLGFEGQYRVIERGSILLSDIRNYINNYLYGNHHTDVLSNAKAEKVKNRKNYLTPVSLFLFGSLIFSGCYGYSEWYLHDQSQSIRNAILAWNPPTPRKINIMETLPQPLPKILNEGWLQIRPDPRGWLLIFTSDGAFATGKSQLSEEFKQKRNIERLGAALSPWPGDIDVIGHTDNSAYSAKSTNSNLKLSAARAEVVAQALREALVNSKYNRTINSIGKGDSEPLDTNDTEEGRRRNRRVDMLWKIGQRDAPPPQQ